MAPEQIEGTPSSASDTFGLSVIAYEMLTGRRPFNPQTPYHMIEAVRSGVRIKPKDLRPDLSSEAQKIILTGLSFEARERYARARDFGELLAQSLTTDLELPDQAKSGEAADLEMAHVLFIDVVGYSRLPTDEQTQVVKQLQQIVSGTESFQRAKTAKSLISRSTGDGMALVYFSGPRAPVECAIEIARALPSQPQVKLRMGINSGPVFRVKDMNETVDVAGAGINMAQRVMDCGDAGHILLSKSVADVLGELGEWRTRVRDLGEWKVKHGVTVHIYNLCFAEIGNPQPPEKMRKKWKPLVTAAAVVLLLLLATAVTIWIKTPDSKSASNSEAGDVRSMEVERVLSFSLKVQEIRGKDPVGKPRQIAGSDEVNFKNFDVRLNVSAAKSAYLYVLNELPGVEDGPPRYQVVYPVLMDEQRGQVSMAKIPEDESQWIPPLDREGIRKLWLVWSDHRVDELEAFKASGALAGSRVEDPAQNKKIQDMLMKYLTSKTRTQRDDAKKQTDVIWKGNTLAYQLVLNYK